MKRTDRDAVDRVIEFCEQQGFTVKAVSTDDQEGEQPRIRIVMAQKTAEEL